MDTKCAGIYALYNVMENKIYVGQSGYIYERFAAHRTNFRCKSKINEMYQEPLENFVFVILYRMDNDEFRENSNTFESLFITQARVCGIALYNKAEVYGDYENYENLVKNIGAKARITNAVKKGCGYPPWGIAQMSMDERRQVRDKMNGEDGYKLENGNGRWYNGVKCYDGRGDHYGTDSRRTQESKYQSREEIAGENGRNYAPSSKGRWCENPCRCCGGKRKCFCVHPQSRMDEDGERAVCAK